MNQKQSLSKGKQDEFCQLLNLAGLSPTSFLYRLSINTLHLKDIQNQHLVLFCFVLNPSTRSPSNTRHLEQLQCPTTVRDDIVPCLVLTRRKGASCLMHKEKPDARPTFLVKCLMIQVFKLLSF